MAPRLTDIQIVLSKDQGIYHKRVIFHKGAYAMIRARGNGVPPNRRSSISAWRGKSPTSYPYTEEEPCSIKKPRPEALLPPPKPRAGFSGRHPSNDVEYSQPRNFAEFFFYALE